MEQPTDTEIVNFLQNIITNDRQGDVHVQVGLYPISKGDWCEETLREAVAREINKAK